MPADRSLEAQATAGDRQAFVRLLEYVQHDVYRFLYRTSGSDADRADDLLQETFMAAWIGIGGFRADASFRTWLLGIAWNVVRQHFRRHAAEDRRRRRYGSLRWPEAASVEELADARPLDRIVELAFSTLARGQREALYLHEILGCTYGETATILGVSTDAVKNRLFSGRARLRKAVEQLQAETRTEKTDVAF